MRFSGCAFAIPGMQVEDRYFCQNQNGLGANWETAELQDTTTIFSSY